MARILVVDDLKLTRHLMCEVLTSMGHKVYQTSNGIEALSLCGTQNFEFLILDYHMPDMNGLELAEQLGKGLRFILHTSDYDDTDIQRRAKALGALGIIQKVSDIASFSECIDALLDQIGTV